MKYKVTVKLRKDFIEVRSDTITVGVMERPQEGKANEEVVRKIAGYFRVPRSFVRIAAGRTSKKKIVEVLPQPAKRYYNNTNRDSIPSDYPE